MSDDKIDKLTCAVAEAGFQLDPMRLPDNMKALVIRRLPNGGFLVSDVGHLTGADEIPLSAFNFLDLAADFVVASLKRGTNREHA